MEVGFYLIRNFNAGAKFPRKGNLNYARFTFNPN